MKGRMKLFHFSSRKAEKLKESVKNLTPVEELYPIGSIIRLKDGQQKMMITSIYASDASDINVVADYLGLPYPKMISQSYLFSHRDIEEVYFRGYDSEEWKEFQKEADGWKTSVIEKQYQKQL